MPVKIGTDEIGGIRDNNRLLAQDLSTIMSQFRNGKPLMRIVSKRGGTPPRDMIPRREAITVKTRAEKESVCFGKLLRDIFCFSIPFVHTNFLLVSRPWVCLMRAIDVYGHQNNVIIQFGH